MILVSNNYWSFIWRGQANLLAEVLLRAYKAIWGTTLKGRTIRGIHYELQAHYFLWKLGIKKSSTKIADMGSLRTDSNAWFWESWAATGFVSQLINYSVKALSSITKQTAIIF